MELEQPHIKEQMTFVNKQLHNTRRNLEKKKRQSFKRRLGREYAIKCLAAGYDNLWAEYLRHSKEIADRQCEDFVRNCFAL